MRSLRPLSVTVATEICTGGYERNRKITRQDIPVANSSRDLRITIEIRETFEINIFTRRVVRPERRVHGGPSILVVPGNETLDGVDPCGVYPEYEHTSNKSTLYSACEISSLELDRRYEDSTKFFLGRAQSDSFVFY